MNEKVRNSFIALDGPCMLSTLFHSKVLSPIQPNYNKLYIPNTSHMNHMKRVVVSNVEHVSAEVTVLEASSFVSHNKESVEKQDLYLSRSREIWGDYDICLKYSTKRGEREIACFSNTLVLFTLFTLFYLTFVSIYTIYTTLHIYTGSLKPHLIIMI